MECRGGSRPPDAATLQSSGRAYCLPTEAFPQWFARVFGIKIV